MADKRKGARQDYVLRVRYQNTLPPPPFEPKMLALPTDFSKYTSASYLSNLYQEQPLRVEADSELGMHMDLSLLPGIFEGEESAMYAPDVPEELDPKDRALLKTDIGQQKLSTDVSFLRRTQYISSDAASAAKIKQAEKDKAARHQADLEFALDPLQQIAAIEDTFTAASGELESLRHPTRKDLRAVEVFPVFPDTPSIQQQWCNAKFATNPAPRAKSNSKMDDTDLRLDVAAILPKVIEEADDDYLSYFLPSYETAEQIRQANDRSTSADNVHRLDSIRDYDAKRDQHEDDYMFVFNTDMAKLAGQ
ncbi:RNA polymerase II-associated [Protomyces lactucae-debilis]|uniref:RNA polymerase II-associated n=1 Tax=Protomyces lactucae-debilis TaxID=2754530 RepID=A0A1Y2FCF8_PROLT|nr:RNA polymerase II-associated [Protomyces lactucae-debilis]ORY81602.1 RNA polymerase II-associated [Protomyces lactucae-debilis]